MLFDKKILSQGCWEKQQIARRISSLISIFPWRGNVPRLAGKEPG
ncbi:hypothetical protein CSC40_0571 [Klebsiella pneumoniae]|nr:hypothetical protein CSC40_0571 [Klebsiella pneumoniae]CCM81648.1 hypothetical protein BN426_1158 [Klebsiella pneumoniae subsp. pneumoniae ST258-K26BO]CDL46912.1 hypothetical protein [Klebsiella pneumoniae ISC21]